MLVTVHFFCAARLLFVQCLFATLQCWLRMADKDTHLPPRLHYAVFEAKLKAVHKAEQLCVVVRVTHMFKLIL